MTLNNIIFICYGVPLVIVYGVSLGSVVSIRRRLTQTFVAIYVMTGVVNLTTYLNAWFALRLQQEQFFNFYYHFANQTFVLSLVHQFFVGYFYFAQNIDSGLLTIDRFVHVVMPNWVEKWKRYWWLLALFVYLLSGLLVFFVADYGTYTKSAYAYNATTDSFSLATRSKPVFICVEATTGVTFVVFCAAINIITFRHLKTMKGSMSWKHYKADRSFFFISLIIFISQSCNIVIIMFYYYFRFLSFDESMLSYILIAMLYTSDIFSLGPGLYTLLVPGPIRRQTIRVVAPARVAPSSDASLTSVGGRVDKYLQMEARPSTGVAR